MDGSFACPQCGYQVELRGLTAGRRVRCGWCEALVEIPFLPRAEAAKTIRRTSVRKTRWMLWAWTGLGLVALLLAFVATGSMIRGRQRAKVEQSLAELVQTADDNENGGRLDEAVIAVEQALEKASAIDPPTSSRVELLQERRGHLVLRMARAALSNAANAAPAQAVPALQAIQARIQKDEALSGLAEQVREQIDAAREQLVIEAMANAHRAQKAVRVNESLDYCERAVAICGELASGISRKYIDEADIIVTEIVQQYGVVFDPILGKFTLGTPHDYEALLFPRLDATMRGVGYAPRRAGSPWKDLWGAKAPFRVATEIGERYIGTYLHSENRLCAAMVAVVLNRAGTSIWHGAPVTGRTRLDQPNMTAMASRTAVVNYRDEKFERVLYENARDQLVEKFSTTLAKIPPVEVPVAVAPSG